MTVATSLFAEELIPPIEVDPVLVTPGVVGFVVTFAVAIGAVLLKSRTLRVQRVHRNKQHGAPVAEKREHSERVKNLVKSEVLG
jgi:hypothetical protein